MQSAASCGRAASSATPLVDADRRALTDTAEIEERVQQENVEVSFDDEPQPR